MKFIILQLLCFIGAWASPRLDPLVYSKRGLIRGLQATDGDYAMFLGIPYALVNYTNPFGPSLPYPDFEETFEAIDDSAICPQLEDFSNQITGSLDCLHLNVYVPNTATSLNRLPVLVWIYGGGFQIGYASRYVYGPKYLVRNDVIVVTINYRVGPYGFMCLDTPDVPGNQGLKDQLNALRWIKENIDAFGGDANKVTIFGESAGAGSVDFQLLSKQEKLFDKVIMQSGTTLGPWAIVESNPNAPTILADKLGFETEDTIEAINFLASVDPKLVIAVAIESNLSFMPCVEKEFEGVERFVAEHPINSEIPKAKNIPILTGYNNKEMLVGANIGLGHLDLDVFEEYLSMAFNFEDDELVTLVRQFYIGDDNNVDDLKENLIDFESDIMFNHPVHRSVQKYLENSGNVYHYIFSYSGDRNFLKWRLNITEDGAGHADEISYLFDVSIMKEPPTEEDQLVIDRITTMWTNFVKYGNPTPEATDLLPVQWTPVTKEVLTYLDIDSELTLKKRPFHDRMAFLDLFFTMNKHLLKGYKDN
ncbi:Bile salt-activated lipase [Papilio machaon]|uniref:Carboxylic ester hydrolase n=1 Tax=Papilio machaon TaxID=76193 RepID=A0A0N1IPF0_PAPMA|nr:Bile salt-activated lipase [Papilio machaon]